MGILTERGTEAEEQATHSLSSRHEKVGKKSKGYALEISPIKQKQLAGRPQRKLIHFWPV